MMITEKAFAIGYCSDCGDREGIDRFITTNENQWLLASMSCRYCASYQVEIEVKNVR